MKMLKPTHHILRWKSVEYDLGKIQNNARLKLIQSNPFHAMSEIELYREKGGWKLDAPRTAVRLCEPDGSVATGFCNKIRLHEDNMRRSDSFKIGGRSGDARRWGTMEIDVGEKTYRITIPSSLYEHLHGRADERNETE
jgi:hypothetical protein